MNRRVYHRALRIVGNDWYHTAGKVFNAKTVDFVQCGDIHSLRPTPRFPKVETLFIRDCDKNFVYSWLDKTVFPSPKKIWLLSHPCEAEIFDRFPNSQILLPSDVYNFYKNHWFSENRKNIKPVTSKQIQHEITVIDLFHKTLKFS